VIEEKLKEARLRSAKRRMQIGIGLFVTICLCGLLVFGLSSYNFSEKDNVPAVVASQKERLSESDREKVRGEFKEILQHYENELEPRLLLANVELWNRDAFFEINELKKKVMFDFSNGDYPVALDNLQLLTTKAVEFLEEAEYIFKENLEKATSFLAEDLYDEAKFHVEKALMVDPHSPEALEVQQEVEKLPHILPLLNGAKGARAENDLQKEYDNLQQVLRIAPEREEVNDRLQVLAELIKTQKFDMHISSGFAGIANGQAKEAGYHYQEAKKLDPERTELSMLLAQLSALEKSLRVRHYIKQAQQAVRRDDWQQVKIDFARAAKDAPENKTVAEGLRRADHVLGLLARFSQYSKNPYRLAHTDVRKEAERTLVQAKSASSYSFAIKRQAEQLSELITKVNRLIPVTVISDNKTYVSVRSVGKVGVVSQKTVQLKPGTYTFEGVRNGFKSKLVQAFIPYDQSDFNVRVICDEPI
jgi:tetratricopeptide (TPR) repeat protein